jgi:radical SAM-linked protein
MIRIRITFSKTEAMRYTGHLDLHRTWERTFRRARLPLAYSQGFHPQPRLNLACALPLGFTSDCEILDAWLENEMEVSDIFKAVGPSLPPGLVIQNLSTVDLKLPSLQSHVQSAEYLIYLREYPSDLGERVEKLLATNQLPRVRRNKSYDLRPLIYKLSLVSQANNDQKFLVLHMSAREGATGRPEELLSQLGIPFEDTRVHRTKLYFAPPYE